MDMLIGVTVLMIFLVFYHHIGYPVLLRVLAAGCRRPDRVSVQPRHYQECAADVYLQRITLIMPAYNEAAYIAEKIRNLAAMDYPPHLLQVRLVCDGCTDDTAAIANKTLNEPACRGLSMAVIEHTVNQGKVNILRDELDGVDGGLVGLSDVSALLSVDALLIGAQHFSCPDVGVVCGAYRLLAPGSAGESAYWRYQSAIKYRESLLGSSIGVHGAFYLFRRSLYEPLPAATINDDFVLPMRIVAQGYRALYDPRIQAVEMECASCKQDFQRRVRIATGNMQQLCWLRSLLHPRHGGVAFVFASGKALRVLMPWCLLGALLGCLLLSGQSWWFWGLAMAQWLGYTAVAVAHFLPESRRPGLLQQLHYMISGYVAGAVGTLHYLARTQSPGPWKRVVVD